MMNEFKEQVEGAIGQQAIIGITAADLMKKEFQEPQWAVPGILPEGLNILAGKPKKGKSLFGLGIGVGITLTGVVLGKIPVEQGAVIYLALEDTQRRLQERLKKMLPEYSEAPANLFLFTKWPRMEAGGLELLEAKILETPGIRLVIIDTLQKFRTPMKGNSNLYAEDYETVSKIKDVADRLSVCILLIHHLRKADATDIFDTLSGSLGLTGGVDGCLVMENVKGDTILHITGRDVEETELAIFLSSSTLEWHSLGIRAEIKATNDQQRIYNALKKSTEPVTPKELAKLTGLKIDNIKKTLPKFLEDGCAQRTGPG